MWSVLNITRKLIKEHSAEILNVECLEYSSPSWTWSILANDQAVKWAKAKVCVYADAVLCVGQVKDISGATERWKGQCRSQEIFVVPRRSRTRRRTGTIRVENFPRISFLRDPERLGDEEHQAGRLQGPDHLHVNVQRH